MDAIVLVALEDDAVVGFAAVGADLGSFGHPSGDDRHQLLPGTIFHDAHIDVLTALVQPDDGDFSTRATPRACPVPGDARSSFRQSPPPPPSRAFAHRQSHHALLLQLIDPMHRPVIQPAKVGRRQRRKIVCKIPQYLAEYPLRNAHTFEILVLN